MGDKLFSVKGDPFLGTGCDSSRIDLTPGLQPCQLGLKSGPLGSQSLTFLIEGVDVPGDGQGLFRGQGAARRIADCGVHQSRWDKLEAAGYELKAAARRIAPSGLGRGTRRPLAASLYARVYPDRYGLGFMVSTTPHGQKRGFHTNRRGRSLPILMWAEDGTRPRRTGHRVLSFTLNSRRTGRWVRHYLRGGQNRGRMKRYDILEQTERAEAPGTESRLFAAFVRSVDREARRAGLL